MVRPRDQNASGKIGKTSPAGTPQEKHQAVYYSICTVDKHYFMHFRLDFIEDCSLFNVLTAIETSVAVMVFTSPKCTSHVSDAMTVTVLKIFETLPPSAKDVLIAE